MKTICLLIFLLPGCAFVDGLHQFRSGSVPAYPPYIADEPCIWHEGGETWLIDKTGAHKLK